MSTHSLSPSPPPLPPAPARSAAPILVSVPVVGIASIAGVVGLVLALGPSDAAEDTAHDWVGDYERVWKVGCAPGPLR